MNEYLSYQDVFLIPQFSGYHTRDEANTSVKFGDRTFKLPIVPANMECVIDTDIARKMSANDYFYIMHRFNKDKTKPANTDNLEFVTRANLEKWKTISVSIGVKDEDKLLIECCIRGYLRIDYLTIDIAHAHSVRMREMIKYVREAYSDRTHNMLRPFIIAGNVATPEAVRDLEKSGADAVKVGIAQGGACTTYGMTGFGVPMFSCMLACAEVAKRPLIADGGIKTNGDFAKAIRAGATMVMAGSTFAACKDAPGENIYSHGLSPDGNCFQEDKNNILKKVYYGSASEYNKGSKRHVEGIRLELPCNGLTYEEKIGEISDSFSSSVSYAGGSLISVPWGIKKS
jgi:GMP reductase